MSPSTIKTAKELRTARCVISRIGDSHPALPTAVFQKGSANASLHSSHKWLLAFAIAALVV
jgi:hypothetical protein